MNPQLDLYGNMSEMRDMLDALLKRGKPASVADLQALVATVEAKSRPTIILPAKDWAGQLVPELLPLLPTPAALAKAGEQAADSISRAIAGGTASSVQQVVAAVQQLTASVEMNERRVRAAVVEMDKAADRLPRSVPVDYVQGWRLPTALVAGPVMFVLLVLWLTGAFSGVSQPKYDKLMETAKSIEDQRNVYRDQIKAYRQEADKTEKGRVRAESFFPAYEHTK